MKHKVKHVEERGLEGASTHYVIYANGIYETTLNTRSRARSKKRWMENNGSQNVVIIKQERFNTYVR